MHINYKAQFSGQAAAKGGSDVLGSGGNRRASTTAAPPSKKRKSSGDPDVGGADGAEGFWLTTNGQRVSR